MYESPHRILATLQDMQEVLGNRKIAIAREVTKKFEEVIRGDIATLRSTLKASKPRGEFVVIF